MSSVSVIAQEINVGIGGWREHIPYNKAIEVASDESGTIYCATKFGLFTYSTISGELETLSRLSELSDQEIATIRYDRESRVFMIAYINSNIDIIYPDKSVVNLADIKQKNIIGGKQINSIFYKNGLAYLSCGFGIVVVDLGRREIKDTYYIGTNGSSLNVYDVDYDGTYLVAATDSGIFRALFNDPNIFNFTSWSRDTNMSTPVAKYTSLASFNGKMFAMKTNPADHLDTLLVLNNNYWSPLINDATEGGYIDQQNNSLVYSNFSRIMALDENGNSIRTVESWAVPNSGFRKGIMDAAGNMWIADFSNGLVWQRPDLSYQLIAPNGPRSEAAWAIQGRSGRLWVASGSLAGDSPVYSQKNGVYYYSDNTWKTFDCSNDAVYQSLCNLGSPAVNCVAVDPFDPDHAFVGSWGNGLLEYTKDGGVTRYDETNSTLHELLIDYIITGGVAFDTDGNLWVVAGGNTRAISVRKRDGTWRDFVISEIAVAGMGLYGLMVDDYGQKWFIARGGSSSGQGVCVFKEQNLDNSNNGNFRRLNDRAGEGALPDMFVRSIVKDKDGSVWLGTNKGVAVVYNPGNIFSGGNFDAQRIIIQQDGYNQYLLEAESVNAIAVDGANRKWFGTSNGGAFLMSADGTKQIQQFNIDNSPLPSNYILGIAIDDVTGEVFFATEKGIISYRGDATEGGEVCDGYFVFPNPIRNDYRGPIAIRGLIANADVKIADVAGNIVYHTKANGGEAIWYGNNMNGERAQTGVYTVLVTNDDGTETCTTKLLFAN